VNIFRPASPFSSRITILGTGLIITITLVLIALNTPKPEPVTNTPVMDSPPKRFAATPLSYTSFVGTITSIDGQRLTISHTIVDTDGKTVERIQQVTAGPDTVIDKLSMDDGSFIARIAVTDLVVGQRLRVANTSDVGSVESFTATTLSLLISSTPTP